MSQQYPQYPQYPNNPNQQPFNPQSPPQAEPRNGFAIVALVVGIAGLVFGLIPLTGFIAVILGATGLIFGLTNIGRIRRRVSTARKMTWFGSILSALALALGVWGMIIVADTFSQL